ncbi:MAG: extracellular solute-binding protein [Streptococcaceae bacterium]|jgi:arabinogalactan oligomer/maltooligosaccharide transport system substrate-binding protein|nr:extracellular solute-binding protein [Streptococcaceae bacterium]
MKSYKKLALAGAAVLATVTLAACSSGSTTSSSSSTSAKDVSGNITLWVDTTQVTYVKPVVTAFEKEYPNVKVTVTQSPTGSSNAKTDVSKDPTKAADVFELPNDQLGQMAQAKYINPLTTEQQSAVKANSTDVAVKGVTQGSQMYGYPFAEQAKILFYNKSVLSASDIKTFNGLTAKGPLALTITDTQNGGQYTMVPNFISNGVKLYGSDGQDLNGSTFNTKEGEQVMSWIAGLKSNKNVIDASTAAIGDLKSGKAAAYFDGPWDSASISKALGSNFAVATYPTVDYGSGTKQMQSFVGIEAFAVNSSSKSQAASAALATYLTSKDTQLNTWWKEQGQIPVSKDAQTSAKTVASVAIGDATTSALVLDATTKQVNFSTLMPALPEMANMWNLSGPLIVGAYNGKITSSQFSSQLSTFNTNIAKSTSSK